jgi:hypothetical protein
MRRPSTFKKADLVRATKALRAAGLGIARVAFSRDGFVIVPGQPGGDCNPVQPVASDPVYNDLSNGTSPADDLDRELAEFNARHDQD